MSRFVKVAALVDVPLGSSKWIEVEGKEVALFNVGGALYALDNLCPHAGGPLAEGTVEGQEVECSWHGARFNLKSGASSSPLAPDGVQIYPVRVNGADIEIEL